jgi:hypothetical protein
MTVASVLSDQSDWNAPTLGNRVSGPRSQPLGARHSFETSARHFRTRGAESVAIIVRISAPRGKMSSVRRDR